MKKLIILTGLLFIVFQAAEAQRGREQLQSARIAFITERLDLTPETAQKFWPVYNQINEQKQALRKEEFSLRRSATSGELTEEKARELLEDMHAIKEKELKLAGEAIEKYQEVISASQTIKLVKAEEDFRHMVLNQLRERRGGRGSYFEKGRGEK